MKSKIILEILNKEKTKQISEKLEQQFGIKELRGLLVKKGKERVFLFQGKFTEKEIKDLEKITPIERAGVYIGKYIPGEDAFRLSIEGTQVFKNQINKNIFELNEEQAGKWMSGQELNLKPEKKGFVVMKYKDNFLGCGKASEEKITNFIPKNRRLKINN
ncbi:MAG TPA: hypothetical protein VJ912_00540 [Candidatus Nanoarchaeia archaeon]|nr:hypothetical protein [Candidatus Nanoarchaeia archaeon]